MEMNTPENYMQMCLNLAAKGLGKVAPNPMVGCIIVYKGEVIGEGYHHKYGEAHAEINALQSVKDKSLLKDASLYVSLEPCSHKGKTPPCADAIIASGIRNITAGVLDPNPLVSGKGIERMVKSGFNVRTGVLEKDCIDLNKRFFTFHRLKRPYIILKWAQTADGFIDRFRSPNETPEKITCEEADILDHQWRSEEQAIMVGTNTVLMDNPRLTVRKVKGRSPIRIVLDRTLRIQGPMHIFDNFANTIIFTEKKIEDKKEGKMGAEYVRLNFGKDLLSNVMNELYKREIQSLIVEGGAMLLGSFIKSGLWEEARVFVSTKELMAGIPAPVFSPPFGGRGLKTGIDTLLTFKNRNQKNLS
jgi:diaminohydroxyphosphoribosylaminopyrimidine deaminase/5-amino-6-(5-phosphoribosylamino)uracil reductase